MSRNHEHNKIMGPPPRLDPLDILRQRSQTPVTRAQTPLMRAQSAIMPPPTQRAPDPLYQPYHPQGVTSSGLASIHSQFPQTNDMLVTQSSPNGMTPRTASQASMREGAGWQAAMRTDSYRPPVNLPGPRSAADVYVQSSQPVQKGDNKGDRILAAIEKLAEDVSGTRESQEELREENKKLRDQLHDLQVGQNALVTTTEMREEVTAQRESPIATPPFLGITAVVELMRRGPTVSPALHDFFATLHTKLDSSLALLPEQFAKLAAEKGRDHLLELEERLGRTLEKDSSSQEPLTLLLNHLITRLDTIADVIADLPQALSDVTVFKGAMELLMTKLHDSPPTPAPTPPKSDDSLDSLKHSLEDLKQSVERSASSQVFEERFLIAMKGIADINQGLSQLKVEIGTSRAPPTHPDQTKLFDILDTVRINIDTINHKLQDPSAPNDLNNDNKGISHQITKLHARFNDLIACLKVALARRDSLTDVRRMDTPLSNDIVRPSPSSATHYRRPSRRRLSPPAPAPMRLPLPKRRKERMEDLGESFAPDHFSAAPRKTPHTRSKQATTPMTGTQKSISELQSSDVFGPEQYVPSNYGSKSSNSSTDKLFNLPNPGSQVSLPPLPDPPSSVTLPSQPISQSNKSKKRSSTDNEQRTKRTKFSPGESSIRTRSQEKNKSSGVATEAIVIEDSPPDQSSNKPPADGTTENGLHAEVAYAEEDSLSSLESTQMNSQTHSLMTTHNPLAQRTLSTSSGQLGYSMARNLSSSHWKPTTYSSNRKTGTKKSKALDYDVINQPSVM